MAKTVFTAKTSTFREYSEGIRIGGGLNFRPAPYLHIVEWDKNIEKGVVMKKGTIVSITSDGYIVPANGGTAQTITYDSRDIEEGVIDIDTWSSTPAAVESAGESSASIAANYPIGVLQYDVFQWDMNDDPWYQVQKQIAILEDYLVMYAIDETRDGENTYTPGLWVVPDTEGYPVPLDVSEIDIEVTVDGTAGTGTLDLSDVLHQVVGRIIKVVDPGNVDMDEDFIAGLEYTVPLSGLGLVGTENGGVMPGMDATTKKGVLIQLGF